MTDFQMHFDDHFDQIKADQARAIARLFGGKSSHHKAQAIEEASQGLADPVRVKAAYEGLENWEKNSLYMLNILGGTADFRTLAVGLLASGTAPKSGKQTLTPSEIGKQLLQRGLVLTTYPYDPGYFSEYTSSEFWSDTRLLHYAQLFTVEHFTISRIGLPENTTFRRPAVIGLDLLGLLQAIEQIGGLSLTKTGLIRVSDLRKLRKLLRWPEDVLVIDGFAIPDPTTACAYALASSGLMVKHKDHLYLNETLMSFADRSVADQVRSLLFGLLQAHNWLESDSIIDRWYDTQRSLCSGRLSLLLALKALPLEGRSFYSPDDFDQVIFERIGQDFRLDGATLRSYIQTEQDSKWRAKRRAEWLGTERWWIEAALKSWLYFFGIVELAGDGNQITGFRLSELGREVLHPQLTEASQPGSESLADLSSGNGSPAWVIQPNFDVVVYLEQANSSQLAFLERHAERLQAHSHTAQYRLTRQSVYRGLEAGSSPEMLLQGLQAGASTELPQNVQIEIEEWTALRERMTLHRRAQLLEFESANALKKAIQKGFKGTSVADRFLLIKEPLQNVHMLNGSTRIDYAQPLAQCLDVCEDGLIERKQGSHDLLLDAQLKQWTEKITEGKWQLSPQSVRSAIEANQKVENLIQLLNERSIQRVPRLLELSLHNWGSDMPYAMELAQATLLHCSDPETFEAVKTSKKLAPFIIGIIHPDIFVVETAKLSQLSEYLKWLEFDLSPELDIRHLSKPRSR